MGLDGYTGPTSGRITIGGDGPVSRERFYDKPLSADEAAAVAWFRALSPHEQLREVRRLKWNLEQAERGRDQWKEISRRDAAEKSRLAAERDARRPDGYELPRAAGELLRAAGEHGWRTARAWHLDEDGQHARLEVRLGRQTEDGQWEFQLSWSMPRDGNGAGSMIHRGLARRPGRSWYDAPPLKEIRRILVGGV